MGKAWIILLACAATLSAADGAGPKPRPHPRVTRHGRPKPLPAGGVVEDWKSFLGPRRNMATSETKLLGVFPADGPKLLWEMSKGSGYSSPSISGDRLVYLHRLDDREIVECLRAETGELYWTFSYPTDFEDRFGYNNGPRASPLIEEDRVWTYGAQGKLHCLKLSTGELIWKRDLAAEFNLPQDFFGTASTPLLEGDLLILNVGAPGGPTVAAFDKTNGKIIWGAGEKWGPSYSSPIAGEVRGRRLAFVFAGGESRPPSGGLLAVDPRDGEIVCRFPWRSRSYESVNAAAPVLVGERVFISASYRAGAALVEFPAEGACRPVWTSKEFDLHWTTAIYEGGYLYGFAGRNEPDAALMAVDAETGKTVWRKVFEWDETIRVNGRERTISESPYRGSLLKVDGRFLALGEHGHLLWLDLSPQGAKILSRATLFLARETWSPPVLSRGLLYISQNGRSFGGQGPRLLCYDLRGE